MLKLLGKFTKKEWLLAALSVAFVVVQVWLSLTMPDYMREITMLIQTPGSEMPEILSAGGMMLACALGSLAASVVTAVCAASSAAAKQGRNKQSAISRKSACATQCFMFNFLP